MIRILNGLTRLRAAAKPTSGNATKFASLYWYIVKYAWKKSYGAPIHAANAAGVTQYNSAVALHIVQCSHYSNNRVINTTTHIVGIRIKDTYRKYVQIVAY